jgi:hypothetical protein
VTLALTEASRALGSVRPFPLAGIATVLYRSESSASSLIEGVGPGPRRIIEAEFAGADAVNDEAARRVVGNLEALRSAVATAVPATVADLLEWHRLLMEGNPRMRPESVGSLRTQQNWIGGGSFGPEDAEYIPPAPEEVPRFLDDLVDFSGRVLLQQVLVQRADLTAPVPVSVPWSRDTDRYISGLRSFQDGDVASWLLFASWSIIEAVGWMNETTERVAELLEQMSSRVETRGRSVAARVIEDLPLHPVVDTPTVAERYDVTPQTAHEGLTRLSEAEILVERPLSRRKKGRPSRVFAAQSLIDLLSAR